MRKTLVMLISILIGCGVNCFAQGKVTRQKKESTTSASVKKKQTPQKTIDQLKSEADRFYDNGQYEKALPLYKELVAKGSYPNANRIGYMFQYGQGVNVNNMEAVKWYRKAAEHGFAAGQNNLGYMFNFGKGVSQDYAEAVKWYRKAADQGYALAQNNLGCMYYNGTGVAIDKSKARELFERKLRHRHGSFI